MLSWSSQHAGTEAAELPHGSELRAFAEAIAGHDDERLAAARAELVAVTDEEFMLDAAAVAANFEMMTRVADGTGSLLR
jgi:hypothetical protein